MNDSDTFRIVPLLNGQEYACTCLPPLEALAEYHRTWDEPGNLIGDNPCMTWPVRHHYVFQR
jgi:hypothetical protein